MQTMERESGLLVPESPLYLVHSKVEKFDVEELPQDLDARKRFRPFEVIEGVGNLIVTGGVTATEGGAGGIWHRLIGGTTVVAYSNANARIGVGDSNTAAANGDTDLNAATNKLRKAMNATFPTISSRSVTFVSDFTSGEANYQWREWGVFNTATAAQGMLNHKVEDLGTKAGGTWTLSVTLTFS